MFIQRLRGLSPEHQLLFISRRIRSFNYLHVHPTTLQSKKGNTITSPYDAAITHQHQRPWIRQPTSDRSTILEILLYPSAKPVHFASQRVKRRRNTIVCVLHRGVSLDHHRCSFNLSPRTIANTLSNSPPTILFSLTSRGTNSYTQHHLGLPDNHSHISPNPHDPTPF